jgi:hypothetical protein
LNQIARPWMQSSGKRHTGCAIAELCSLCKFEYHGNIVNRNRDPSCLRSSRTLTRTVMVHEQMALPHWKAISTEMWSFSSTNREITEYWRSIN